MIAERLLALEFSRDLASCQTNRSTNSPGVDDEISPCCLQHVGFVYTYTSEDTVMLARDRNNKTSQINKDSVLPVNLDNDHSG